MTSPGPVVSNAGPLIALEQIGHLALLERLISSLLVPPAVVLETAPTVTLPSWISERPLTQPIGPQILRASLGPASPVYLTQGGQAQTGRASPATIRSQNSA